ncbi:sugar nucleotide oxidoreductaseepimerase [Dyella lipolytica]|uniref:NAD(P)-dependent oxidoreductase n=1 Tax=Dyella lipolytica TaxID=1867835 RepID=A0ABW8IQR0_9GAMM|nr:NAD(P)-dependent oxidoreductase [Dyella lipolytica]GLQ47110.1 sugar nucleotide oxidoreductaseepimerase [Dyella lipolytica]
MRFTVIGATGFIGGALVKKMRAMGFEVLTTSRDTIELPSKPGHIIYAAGVTADFRERPFDTLDANTTVAARVLKEADFDSFLYLSSTRLYRHAGHGQESAAISLRSDEPDQLYDLTKLTGEAICYASGRQGVRIARLANVLGSDFRSKNFVFEIIRDACEKGIIELRTSLDSSKDYIYLDDVVDILPKIALSGKYNCYNVASGRSISHRDLLKPIQSASGASLTVRVGAPVDTSPSINIDRLKTEFSFEPTSVLPILAALVTEYRKQIRC